MSFTNVTNTNGSTFLSINSSLKVYFNETIFISNTLSDADLIKGTALIIVFYKCLIHKNNLKASNSTGFSFFDLASNLFLISSFISDNILKNAVMINSIPFDSSMFFYVGSTIFENNIGYMTSASLMVVSGNHLSFKMQNVSFEKNQGFTSLVSVSKTFDSVFIQDVIFHSNSIQIAAIKVEFAKEFVLQSVKCFQNITIPSMMYENKGTCLILKEVLNFNIQDLDISNACVLDNIAGVIIYQSNLIQEAMNIDMGKNYTNPSFLIFKLAFIPSYFERYRCFNNSVISSNSYSTLIGNCLYIDSIFPINIFNCSFSDNSIKVVTDMSKGGNPCINSINQFSEIFISNSFFISNQGCDSSNCINFIGKTFILNNSFFLLMSFSSITPKINNIGVLNLSSNYILIFNVTFANNTAFKGASIFLAGTLNSLNQYINCTQVNHFIF